MCIRDRPEVNREPIGEKVSVVGRLYVTIDKEKAAAVYPGQAIRLGGNLYAPGEPKNPNGFDFAAYLKSRGAFAGFSADWLKAEDEAAKPGWGLWQIRQRIAEAHEQGMGPTAGPLVSAMALGRQAVNLPYDLQDTFIAAGLAHTLAASGFHVSLVLGVVLGLLKSRSPWVKVVVGTIALTVYVGLTGAQPSVMRAAFMGGGALIGLASERQVKPLGCLLVAVTLLLAINPHWIDSIGFRLSVMATLGLMVSVQPITRWLDFLPPTLATMLAVPVAAYFWVLPMQLYYFNGFSTYSILINMVATPLVTVISLGGIATGLVAAIAPWLGAMLAWPIQLPARVLIALVQWQVDLPGSTLATGQISLGQMLGLYGLFLLGWLQPWGRRRRWLLAGVAIVLAMLPLWIAGVGSQATVLAAGNEPVLVVRDQRQTLLVNSGEAKTAFYTVNPFLQQAGVNRLAWAVALPNSAPESWQTVTDQTPIQLMVGSNTLIETGVRSFEALLPKQNQQLGPIGLENLGAENPILRFTLATNSTWLMLPALTLELQRHLAKVVVPLASEVLWWNGEPLAEELMAAVGPKVAIASAYDIDPDTEAQMVAQGIQVFCTERDGAILWNPKQGFRAYLHSRHNLQGEID
ncbi:competence protein [filamentous cyanobacterium CCP5]|nr:competence protein [filamentous cyanobacterium CCP5]